MRARWEDVLEEQLVTLPPGIAWPSSRDSMLAAILEPLARGLADLYDAADAMLLEIDPRAATWLLPDYEEALGPDPCRLGGYTETLVDRRIEAHARWVAGGGQSVPFFLTHARVFDPGASIEEFAPFQCGVSECGESWSDPRDWFAPEGLPLATETGALLVDENGREIFTGPLIDLPPRWQLGPPEMRFAWRVSFTPPAVTWFRTGQDGGQCGVDPLCGFERQDRAECVLQRRSPAHGDLVFDYTAPAWRAPQPLAGVA